MKARELRIGNWLNNNEEDYQIGYVTISLLERGDSEAKPIPLTEEWFIKFECEQVGSKWRLIEGFHYIEFDLCSAYIGGIQIAIFEYVHQFQNLIFALTGEELTIKHLE